jgi:D-alanyl-D-alanine carboxypeptidase
MKLPYSKFEKIMRIFIFIILFTPLFTFGQIDSIAAIVESYINTESENPVHSILLYIENKDENFLYNKAFDNTDPNDHNDLKKIGFKIASVTKLFLSTVVLQLVEEGKLNLEDKAFQYLSNVKYLDFENFHIYEGKNYSGEISIDHLLSHRSGLADIFTDKQSEFFGLLLQDPQKQYSPEAIVDLYHSFQLNEASHFKPGTDWYYSDMNYVLLGLIIESTDKQPLHQSIRSRIITPLNLENTYLEFYESPIEGCALQKQYVGNVNFSDLNTSFDWAGGGLVSTTKDLSIFIRALFENKLISRSTLKEMINVKDTKDGNNRYGLGIYESEYNGKVFYGHYGFYGSYIGYCPEDRTIISYSISQAMPDFSVYSLINEILKRIEQ